MKNLMSLDDLDKNIELKEGFTGLDLLAEVCCLVSEKERAIPQQHSGLRNHDNYSGLNDESSNINGSVLSGKPSESMPTCWGSKKRRGNPAMDVSCKASRLAREKVLKRPMVIDDDGHEKQSPSFDDEMMKKLKESDRMERLEREEDPQLRMQERSNSTPERSYEGSNDSEEELHDLPEMYKNCIREMNGSDCKLVMQKKLTKTDVNLSETRLLISMNEVKNDDFIDEGEKEHLSIINNGKYNSIEAQLIEPNGAKLRSDYVHLRRWRMAKKKSGKGNYYYALAGVWGKIVRENRLEVNDVIQLYSFRVDGVLFLALVIVQKAVRKPNNNSTGEGDGDVDGSSKPKEGIPEGASSEGSGSASPEAIEESSGTKITVEAIVGDNEGASSTTPAEE